MQDCEGDRAQNKATLARFQTLHWAANVVQRWQQLVAAGRSVSLAFEEEVAEDSRDFQAALDAQVAESCCRASHRVRQGQGATV